MTARRATPAGAVRARVGRAQAGRMRASVARVRAWTGLTGRGAGLAGAAVLLLAAGFRYGYRELALLGAAAAVAVGCAVAVAVRRPRLDVTRRAEPERVARGDPAAMTLTVRNAGRLRAATLVAVDRCGAGTLPVPLLRLRPGRETTVTYPVPTRRRGLVTAGPLTVTRRDPLGLVSPARRYGPQVTFCVHPRVHAVQVLPAGLTRNLDGSADRVPQGTITFDALRAYVVGDELRRVHWRSSAKVGELMVREQVDTSEPSIVVLLDDRAAAHPAVRDEVAESFEAACEAAASVLAAALREGVPAGLHLVAGGAGGRDHLDTLTRAGLAGGDGGELDRAVRRLRQRRLGDTLVFLTGPGGRGVLGAVSGLRPVYPAVVVGLFGDADGAPVSAGDGLTVIEAADGAGFAAAWNGTGRW